MNRKRAKIAIGIRADPKAITFAIFDTAANAVIDVEEIRIPAAFLIPAALKYVRSNLLDVLREYNVQSAGIRVTEPVSKVRNIERIQIEGVIQEAFASSELQSYDVGQIASISKRLGIDRKKFKPLVDGNENPGVQNWEEMSTKERETLRYGSEGCLGRTNERK